MLVNEGQIQVITDRTLEKFLPVKDILIPFLTGLLFELDALEAEFMDKCDGGHTVSIADRAELMQEYRERSMEIIGDRCTPKLIKRCRFSCLSRPGHYAYLFGAYKLHFIMKSAKKAAIEIEYAQSIIHKQKFMFRLTDNGWKLNEVHHGFGGHKSPGEPDWYLTSLL